MPRLPKWMADAMEKLFSGSYHPVKVSSTERLTDQLLKVKFSGDYSGVKKPYIPGQVIEFRVNDTEFRHYTPSFFDAEQGVCEVIFYLHNQGPGSRWAQSLKVGDTLSLMGFGGNTSIDFSMEQYVVFGDETSLGLMQSISKAAVDSGKKCFCIAELDQEHLGWPQKIDLTAHTTNKSTENPAEESIRCLNQWLRTNKSHQRTKYYLTGNARSIKKVKQHLMDMGVERKNIKSEAYWVEGKRGL